MVGIKDSYDIIIIGSGAGGGTIAHELAPTGKEILIIERGGFLPREKENWDPAALFLKGRYNPDELWIDKKGNSFTPGTHYYVGGNTKFYGAALLRLREKDFEEVRHWEGTSPSWPLSYKDFQPYYLEAEKLYEVHGKRGADPTEPPEKAPYPFPAVSHEACIETIFNNLKKEGLSPFPLPLGIRINEKEKENSLCIRCNTCDGFPCLADAKSDAQHICINPALKHPNVHLLTHTKALRLIAGRSDRIEEVEVEKEREVKRLKAKLFIVSCGAINSAALLLRSKTDRFPQGLANSSRKVGRRYMCHHNSAIVALSLKENPVIFQKTIGLNDYYFGAEDSKYPLGHIQLLGKVMPEMLQADAPLFAPSFATKWMANHAYGWWITSEDLPDEENRVVIDDQNRLHLLVDQKNKEAHRRLLIKLKTILKHAGCHYYHFPNAAYFSKKIPLAGVAHQVGTLCFGKDPKESVLDLYCRSHDHENLFVVDGSFFPSSGAVNPALTIIANAIRVGNYICKNELKN